MPLCQRSGSSELIPKRGVSYRPGRRQHVSRWRMKVSFDLPGQGNRKQERWKRLGLQLYRGVGFIRGLQGFGTNSRVKSSNSGSKAAGLARTAAHTANFQVFALSVSTRLPENSVREKEGNSIMIGLEIPQLCILLLILNRCVCSNSPRCGEIR